MSPDMDPVAVALRTKKDDMLTRYIAHAKCYGCYRYVALGNLVRMAHPFPHTHAQTNHDAPAVHRDQWGYTVHACIVQHGEEIAVLLATTL